LNSDLEGLKMEHEKEMSDMNKFLEEISEALHKCKESNENTNSYRRLLGEWTQSMEKVSRLRESNRKMKEEQILLKESCENTKRLREEVHEMIYVLWTKQKQKMQSIVGDETVSQVISSYISVIWETKHGCSVLYLYVCIHEHQVLEDNIQLLQKQKALLIQQRDLAVKQQHPFTVSQMSFEKCQQELEQITAQDDSLLQMEMLEQKHHVQDWARRKWCQNPGKLTSEHQAGTPRTFWEDSELRSMERQCRGAVCVFPQDQENPIWILERLTRFIRHEDPNPDTSDKSDSSPYQSRRRDAVVGSDQNVADPDATAC
ncbi:hypothetical protein STEG23_027107, partial [Scotinomys teguina]